ncbi:DUF4097 family beta strand repeat-containing protein [Tengunoibacter tsumagoiensis]|uniref:DUF4097 domain-containing protein n=1 Tax=Tengunoibacter tsumagoiensis TaxID=2014871 RepID=A0A402A5L2_9CHLR|nr:DUF4097 family beta strand repeat-containing protein [Tengunoibacter tsumagoiensis]GCE14369.1 hypothetical protein KTT_42280 [Tengunoibacter tsumagoiensis]
MGQQESVYSYNQEPEQSSGEYKAQERVRPINDDPRERPVSEATRLRNDDPRERPYADYGAGYTERSESENESEFWHLPGEKLKPRRNNFQRPGFLIGIGALLFIFIMMIIGGLVETEGPVGILGGLIFLFILGFLLISFLMTRNKVVSDIETFEFAVSELPRFLMDHSRGNVRIHTGEGNAVVVQATRYARGLGATLDGITIQPEQYGNTIQTRVHYVFRLFLGWRGVDFDVTVPKRTDLNLRTGWGRIDLDGVIGRIEANTGNGTLIARNCTGYLTMRTGNGQMELDNVEGTLRMNTGNGSAQLNNVEGDLIIATGNGSITGYTISGQARLTTGNGRIDIQGCSLNGDASLRTGNGSITYAGTIDPKGSYRYQTGNGSIELTLPANAAFQLRTITGNGRVNNEFGSTSVGAVPQAELTTRTGNGSISIYRRNI